MYLPLDFQYQYYCPWISHHIGDWAKIYPGSFNTTIWTTDTKEKLEEEICKPMHKESHNFFFWGTKDISNSWRYMACSWKWQGVKAKIYQESSWRHQTFGSTNLPMGRFFNQHDSGVEDWWFEFSQAWDFAKQMWKKNMGQKSWYCQRETEVMEHKI